mgnify:FL=1
MERNVLTVEFSQEDFKKSKDKKEEIKKCVCALLNSDGGKLVLKATDAAVDKIINPDVVIRPIFQYFQKIVTISEICGVKLESKEYDCIILRIPGLSAVVTLNTNLYLPTDTEVLTIPANDRDTVQEIVRERRIFEIFEPKIPEEFLLGSNCGMRESKTVQFKHLKTETTKSRSFADRVFSNRFANIISAFANASGGCICYGIDDRGMVVGESLSSGDERNKITKKLETAIQKMTWPKSSGEIKRGEQWDIQFVPVKNSKNETITLTFIIVVSIQPCSGGVFTQEPESYYVENNEVKEMPVEVWKANVFYKVPKPMRTLERIRWSKPKEAKNYMRLTERLENFRQLGKWETIEKVYETFTEGNNFSVNTKLIVIFQLIAVKYRQGNDVARDLLEKFRAEMNKAEDEPIFKLEERYSTSAIERSQGEYKKAWNTIDEGLKIADKAPAGFVTASFFAQAALVLSHAVDDESFIGMSEEDEDFKKETDKYVERAENYCHWALQHLMYIQDEFEIAREELKQRVKITLAVLHLKSIDIDHGSVSSSAIKNAAAMISEAEKSLMILEGTPRLKYNQSRLLIAKSDLYFKKYRLEKTVNTRLELLNESLQYVQEAQDLATKHGFEEIKKL